MRLIDKKYIRYLDIAGFLIRVTLLKMEGEKVSKNYIHMVDSLFNGFTVTPPGSKPRVDYSIDIEPTPPLVFLNKSKNAYVNLYNTTANPKKIVTFYSISSPQFQLILMQVLCWLLVNKGFIIHCSAIKIGNQALLFLGKQGAGKSTVTSLLSDTYEVLADDSGIIKVDKGKYFFYQNISKEKNETIKKTSKRYPIRAICLLKKSPTYDLVRLTNKKSLFEKLSFQVLGDLKDTKLMIAFLLVMVNNFNDYYSLLFAKNKCKLKPVISNELL